MARLMLPNGPRLHHHFRVSITGTSEMTLSEEPLADLMVRLNRRIGVETSPVVTEVTAKMIHRFAIATGEQNPVYLNAKFARATPFGRVIAPPTFVAAFVDTHFPEIVVQDLPFATMLHADDAVTLSRPIGEGDVITAFARYVGADLRTSSRGPRLYQMADLELHDSLNEQVANVRITTVSF